MSALKAMSKSVQMNVNSSENPGAAPSARVVPGQRGVSRYNSGGVPGSMRRAAPSRRSAPKRSQSHRIGRPAFNTEIASQEVPRTVSRSNSQRFTRAAPVRTNSFQRTAPNRSASSNSMRALRVRQQVRGGPIGKQIEVPDDGDSVFTSASNQTMDSVALRKKQIKTTDGVVVSGVPAMAGIRSRRLGSNMDSSVASSSFDFDESLHTVDSINVHMKHVQQPGDDNCDLSVFSESFVSSDTYALSDYEEDEDERFENLREDEEFEELS